MSATRMNTIGIDDNLNRARIRKLLAIGLFGCVLCGIGDFLLGYAVPADVGGGMFDAILATAPNCSDAQLIAGGLFGMVGLFLEAGGFFGIYRLMADAAPDYAHTFRASIFGYLWLAPIGCHLNVGVLNYAYKYLFAASPELAHQVLPAMYLGFCLPAYVLLVFFWLPGIIVQWKAFAQGKTPYPTSAKWFNLFTGAVPTLAISFIIGAETVLGGGIGTAFLSVGNAVTFGGLLATMPPDQRFAEFRREVGAE